MCLKSSNDLKMVIKISGFLVKAFFVLCKKKCIYEVNCCIYVENDDAKLYLGCKLIKVFILL